MASSVFVIPHAQRILPLKAESSLREPLTSRMKTLRSMQCCLSTRIRSQAARSIRAGIGSAIKKSRALTAAGSAQSAASGGRNVNDTRKTVSAFENGGGLFVREQFVRSSLQFAQVAVDGGFRGAQLGGDLADGALHIKDACVVQRLHDANLLFHRQPVWRQPGAAGHLGNGVLYGVWQGTDKVFHPDAGGGGLGVRAAEGEQFLIDKTFSLR